MLIAFAFQDCYDPRDAVFGLLGLAESLVLPDYKLEVMELYMYVWLEGLRDISCGVSGSGYREPWMKAGKNNPKELFAHNLHLACTYAFRLSAQHMTVQLVVQAGSKIYKIPQDNGLA